jgi:hypothetical protein
VLAASFWYVDLSTGPFSHQASFLLIHFGAADSRYNFAGTIGAFCTAIVLVCIMFIVELILMVQLLGNSFFRATVVGAMFDVALILVLLVPGTTI